MIGRGTPGRPRQGLNVKLLTLVRCHPAHPTFVFDIFLPPWLPLLCVACFPTLESVFASVASAFAFHNSATRPRVRHRQVQCSHHEWGGSSFPYCSHHRSFDADHVVAALIRCAAEQHRASVLSSPSLPHRHGVRCELGLSAPAQTVLRSSAGCCTAAADSEWLPLSTTTRAVSARLLCAGAAVRARLWSRLQPVGRWL